MTGESNGVLGSPRRRALVEYGCAIAVSVIAAVWLLRLWRADLRVPFDYHDDALYFGMLVKSVVDGGWFLTIKQLGAPGVLAMHDFPSAEAFHLLVVKAMSCFTSDWALIFNLYFLLGFPLITVSALAVFRHFRVAFGPALAGSVLYAFLPRRLLPGEMHYFLDIFYQVPLAVLVALWVAGPEPPLLGEPGRGWWPGLGLRRGRSVAALAICALTSATGIYYAFFAGVLILLGGAWASLARRTPRNALAGVFLTGVIVAGLGVQALPNLVQQRREGANSEVAARQPGESEIFGMRMAQLLLPVPEHRVPALRQLRRRYDALAPFPGESSMTALGVAGSVGFLALLALMLLPIRRAHPRQELSRALAVLNLLALLVATMGGLGSLFALLVTPQIRAYARMQVFIAFLALFALVLLLERACETWGGRLAWLRPIRPILPIVVLVLGLLDQVTPPAVRPYAAIAAQYGHDRAFVRRIEASVPAAAMIFELPYQPFPEADAGASRREIRYEPLRPYFHSASLRWSYPAMLGRPADVFARKASARPPAELVQTVSDAGFDGILIDRGGYEDDGAGIEAGLGGVLGADPAVSDDGRLVFFDLTAHNRRVREGLTPEDRERRRAMAVHPLYLRFTDGFYPEEHAPDGAFRWCAGSGEIEIDNDSHLTRQATLTMILGAPYPSSTLFVRGDLLSESIEVDPGGTLVRKTLEIPPGRHRIHFHSNGQPAAVPGDPRRLVWRTFGTMLEEPAP